jgi:uncharacterized spore protein YtfJ
METEGAGQEGMEECFGSGQGPNWAVEPLAVVVVDNEGSMFLRNLSIHLPDYTVS